jgi:hypothetical protein
MTPADLALLLFNAVNCIRLLAYAPQVLAIVRDHHGAAAVSCLSWVLFALAHLSTAIYAWVTAGDVYMTLVFAVNFFACAIIVALTLRKRAASTRLAAR